MQKRKEFWRKSCLRKVLLVSNLELWKSECVSNQAPDSSSHRWAGRYWSGVWNLEQIRLDICVRGVENKFKIRLTGHLWNIVMFVHHLRNVHDLKMETNNNDFLQITNKKIAVHTLSESISPTFSCNLNLSCSLTKCINSQRTVHTSQGISSCPIHFFRFW